MRALRLCMWGAFLTAALVFSAEHGSGFVESLDNVELLSEQAFEGKVVKGKHARRSGGLGEMVPLHVPNMHLHSDNRPAKLNRHPSMSLGEIQAAVMGTTLLSAEGLKHFRATFVKLAKSMQEPRLKESALLMEEMSTDALEHVHTPGNATNNNGGMKLVYKRLKQLQDDILSEGKQDADETMVEKEKCTAGREASSVMITEATTTTQNNGVQVNLDLQQIKQNDANWKASSEQAAGVHEELMALFRQRVVVMNEAAIRIDERNKALSAAMPASHHIDPLDSLSHTLPRHTRYPSSPASRLSLTLHHCAKAIDVIIMATFIVCEKFKRFMSTPQCLAVKAQPDVLEPGQIPGDSATEAKPSVLKYSNITKEQFETHENETLSIYQSNATLSSWAQLATTDAALEDDPNPENWARDENGQSAAGRKKLNTTTSGPAEGNSENTTTSGPAEGNSENLAESMEEDDMLADGALSQEESHELVTLRKLSKQKQTPRTAIPLGQLVVALQTGETKKALNLVTLLINVKDQIHQEQLTDKFELEQALEDFYRRAWELQAQLQHEKDYQDTLVAESATCYTRLIDLLADNEKQRKIILEQRELVKTEHERCEIALDAYGSREAVRQDDIENIVKLVSLLRALYDQRYPTNCNRGLHAPSLGEEPPLCSGETVGWCVYFDEKSPEQRCSCWEGFYGDACQYIMCPGSGHMHYKHDQVGVCSNNGVCNKMTGQCETCSDSVKFHGEKQACELTHCPGSGADEDIMDDQCSGHGSCYQKMGICDCEYEWSGAGCFFKKCPASNGVLYPIESTNACDSHGACDTTHGTCSCEFPWSGATCGQTECPANCLDRGECDSSTGKCFCREPHSGPRCEFSACPDDCSSEDNGWCDDLTGQCMCKYGYGGEACKQVQYCKVEGEGDEQANTDWYRVWDNPGWALCPAGEAIHALYRNDCETLSCVDQAKCSGLCEASTTGQEHLELRHCYHSLSWYESFDVEGWSGCEPNYFISGLYRSCESLYCLQMAKCCSFKEARWALCEEKDWGDQFSAKGWVDVSLNKWFTELWRGKGHQLRDLQKVKACTYARGF